MTRAISLIRLPFRAAASAGIIGAIATVALAGCPSGGVGDPCIPEDEYKEDFSGFTLNDEFIESRSFQCQTRICLVNHFQGRVSCPQGQTPPTQCTNTEDACANGEICATAGAVFSNCNPDPCEDESQIDCANGDGQNEACAFEKCNDAGYCECTPAGCPSGYKCDDDTKRCVIKVCCVDEDDDDKCDTEGDAVADRCFRPGSDVPIATSVCPQCTERGADKTVYCSCRCGQAEGEEEDDNFNFCECPDGFSCEEIRPNVGLGDVQLTGKYCIRDGSKWIDDTETPCGSLVEGAVAVTGCDGQLAAN